MGDRLESLVLDRTDLLLWTPQTGGSHDLEYEPLPSSHYLNGSLVLENERHTFNRANELLELYKMVTFQLPTRDTYAYLQLSESENVWIQVNRPEVKKYRGRNSARLRLMGAVLGGTATHQDGYNLSDFYSVSNDWVI